MDIFLFKEIKVWLCFLINMTYVNKELLSGGIFYHIINQDAKPLWVPDLLNWVTLNELTKKEVHLSLALFTSVLTHSSV